MAEEATTTKEKNEKIYKVENVYARVEGGNDQITFDAKLNGKKIPVTTVNHNSMESHFVFDKPDETDAKTVTTEASAQPTE